MDYKATGFPFTIMDVASLLRLNIRSRWAGVKDRADIIVVKVRCISCSLARSAWGISLLGPAGLGVEHLRSKRGLTDAQIDQFGFKSTPPPEFCRILARPPSRKRCGSMDRPQNGLGISMWFPYSYL